jgi:hypothetical protein
LTMRIDPGEFRARSLRVHALLHDIPLEDVWAIPLPGGGAGRTIQDVRTVFIAAVEAAPPVVKGLLACGAASEPGLGGITSVLLGTLTPSRIVSARRIAPSPWLLRGHRTEYLDSSTALRTSS